MERSNLFKAAAAMVLLAAGVYLTTVALQLASFLFDIAIVVFLAWIIASNGRRLTLWLQGITNFPFGFNVAMTYGIILLPIVALLVLFIPLAIAQAVQLASAFRELGDDAPAVLENLEHFAAGFGIEADLQGIYETGIVAQASTILGDWLLNNAVGIASTTVGTLFRLFLIFSLSLYMVVEAPRLGAVFIRVAPRGWQEEIEFVYETMDRVFSQWLRGVLIIGSIFSALTFTVMLIAGLPYAVAFSLIASFLVLIPFIDDFIAIGLPVAAALSEGSILKAMVVGGVLAAIDILVINTFISPRLLGQAVRLPTVFVILSVLVGAKIAGAWGAFLGVPVSGLLYSVTIAFADRAQGRTPGLVEPG